MVSSAEQPGPSAKCARCERLNLDCRIEDGFRRTRKRRYVTKESPPSSQLVASLTNHCVTGAPPISKTRSVAFGNNSRIVTELPPRSQAQLHRQSLHPPALVIIGHQHLRRAYSRRFRCSQPSPAHQRFLSKTLPVRHRQTTLNTSRHRASPLARVLMNQHSHHSGLIRFLGLERWETLRFLSRRLRSCSLCEP